MINFNVIKENNIDLPILEECLKALPRGYGFKGSTHREYRDYGTIKAAEDGQNFGYSRTKGGLEYWVLPYIVESDSLDVIREVDGVVVSCCLTEDEFKNFGFDAPEDV